MGTVGRAGADGAWDAGRIRMLRERMGLTQAEMADRVGTRQQTISEWETGTRAPRPMSRRLLRMVAEEAGLYDVDRHLDEDIPPAEGVAP